MQSLDHFHVRRQPRPRRRNTVQKLDKQGRAMHRKRKDAVARVWVRPAAAKIEIIPHDRSLFRAAGLRMLIQQPLAATTETGSTTSSARSGGGLSGQAGAVVTASRSAAGLRAGPARRAQEGRFLT